MHFSLEDNFKEIIESTLKTKVLEFEQILTGWTNFVFKVKLKNKKVYVFRFPRNSFFAKTLKKEEFICNLLKNKVPFKIPNIKLYYHQNKPFTKHKFMRGKTLNECMETLKENEIIALSKDIAKFLSALKKIKFFNNQMKHNNKTINLTLLSAFLKGLSKNSVSEYDLSKHNFLIDLEKQEVALSHGDFNPGNILLNNKNRMIAVLDFAFFGLASPQIDVSRMIGRLPENYKQPLKTEYEKALKTTLQVSTINKLVKCWDYVEKKYIEYIHEVHKDIILPKNVKVSPKLKNLKKPTEKQTKKHNTRTIKLKQE